MKKIFCLLIAVYIIGSVDAQNLVPNPSFEEYSSCPEFLNQFTYVSNWSIAINTPDLFNTCSIGNETSIPNNIMGFQNPINITCHSYAGIITYVQFNPGSNEFIGVKLNNPLIIGTKYYVSFYANLANGYAINCGTDKLGALFTNMNYGELIQIPAPVIHNFAHVYSSEIIIDTVNWTKISGSFIADSSYNYILIGNFFEFNNTNTSCIDSNSKWAYYYIDYVCVSTDSLTCNSSPATCDVDINNVNLDNDIKIFPNPVNDNVFIEIADYNNVSIEVFNFLGENLNLNMSKNLEVYTIDFSNKQKGFYLIKILFDNKIINNKIIKL